MWLRWWDALAHPDFSAACFTFPAVLPRGAGRAADAPAGDGRSCANGCSCADGRVQRRAHAAAHHFRHRAAGDHDGYGRAFAHVPTYAHTHARPLRPYTIDALAARAYGGGELQIVEQLESTDRFARYLITYPSDGLTIQGFMNVPHEGSSFPVAIVLHGYVNPDQYQTLAYTTRYADALANAGYLVIHPNLRGFPPAAEEGDDAYRTGLAADVLNLIAVIRAQSQDPLGPLRRADTEAVHLWGHSMGGGVALRVATILGDAPYLRAAVLYGAMSGDERLNYERIREWSGGQSGAFELETPPEALRAISPIDHLDRLRAPLSIHHGDADETVPPDWSADLCARLAGAGSSGRVFHLQRRAAYLLWRLGRAVQRARDRLFRPELTGKIRVFLLNGRAPERILVGARGLVLIFDFTLNFLSNPLAPVFSSPAFPAAPAPPCSRAGSAGHCAARGARGPGRPRPGRRGPGSSAFLRHASRRCPSITAVASASASSARPPPR